MSATTRIERDVRRFKEIVRGRIRRDLKKYMSSGELIGRKGKDLVSIPLPQIQLPRFRYGDNQGGVGSGKGEEGDPVSQGEDGDGDGAGQAGESPGQHILEVDVGIDELAEIMGEELELPKIEPKGSANVVASKDKYNKVAPQGPDALRHMKRTYKRALQRQIAAGSFDPKNPSVVPVRGDMRYRSWTVDEKPERNAVILYMMDVSGSMGALQKEIVRMEAFWIDTWLQSQYDGLETRFIIHDAAAREVDRETFFHTRESGGTLISTAYTLCQKIIDADYPSSEWNIYPFHFSDGDNWSGSDTRTCLSLLREQMLPKVNAFCYGQVESEYGSGQFLKDLRGEFGGEEPDDRVILSRIADKDGVMDSIKTFLGKGK
ncbi:MAG: DUF444 family protein [Deltaproteobacteria bacterium]|nr:DUF444 family protein [Deltaproteobacteria bacterium]